MRMVIDIPNSLYANLKKIQRGSIASKRLLDCIKEGVPLPKGHGDLIDVKDLIPDADYEDGIFGAVSCQQIVEAEVIIEADEEENEETETWNGFHGQITAPKGTFEQIFNDTDDDNDI